MLGTELRRAIFSKGFVAAIGLIFILYYLDGRQTLNNSASVITLLDLISSVGSFTWLIPCVGVLCYAGSYVKEYDSGHLKYKLIRSGLSRYVLTKSTAVAVSAFLATCLGIALYALCAYGVCGQLITLENMKNYEPYVEDMSYYSLVANGHFIAYILIHIMLHGMAAAMWALGAFALSSVWRNIYIALFSPAIVVYFKDYLWSWLSLEITVNLKVVEMGELHICGWVLPLGLSVAIFMGVSFAFIAVLYFHMRRRLSDA